MSRHALAAPFVAKARLLWDRDPTPRTVFAKRFDLPDGVTAGALELRSSGMARVSLNGRWLRLAPLDHPGRSARRLDVSAHLRPGENRLRVAVLNRRGPGLLSVRLEAGDVVVKSDETWSATLPRRPTTRAALATDRISHPSADRFPSPWSVLRARWPTTRSV